MFKATQVLCIFMLIAVPLNTRADAEARTIAYYGVGSDSCAKLVQEFRTNGPRGFMVHKGRRYNNMSDTYQEWMSGYFTAYNVFNSRNGDFVAHAADVHELMEWVHVYCQQHPTDTVIKAANGLIIYMSQRAADKR